MACGHSTGPIGYVCCLQGAVVWSHQAKVSVQTTTICFCTFSTSYRLYHMQTNHWFKTIAYSCTTIMQLNDAYITFQ